jgi:hypothetical protein
VRRRVGDEGDASVAQLEHAEAGGGFSRKNDVAARRASRDVGSRFEPEQTRDCQPAVVRPKIGLAVRPIFVDFGAIVAGANATTR